MYIFDLDGTLANIYHRLHYILGKNKDYRIFYKECVNDTPIYKNIKLLQDLKENGIDVIILTGRSEEVKNETIEWLNKNGIKSIKVIMRKQNDYRLDSIVKPELLDNYLKEYGLNKDIVNIIFEDRESMVNKWRELGYTCFQVK